MKTNFKKIHSKEYSDETSIPTENSEKKLTQKEFEDYVVGTGAKGSFMIYRSENKDDELGIDEL